MEIPAPKQDHKSLTAKLAALWRRLRGHPPLRDHSEFGGSYEEWRQRFADLAEKEKTAVTTMMNSLSKSVTFALVIQRETKDSKSDSMRILNDQLWPSMEHVFIDQDQTLSSAQLPQADWILMVRSEDLLRPYVFVLLALAATKNQAAEIIYGDEDYLNAEGALQPFMKPDWSPELFESTDYVGIVAVKRSFITKVECEDELIQTWIARCLGQASDQAIHHIPHALVQRESCSGAENAHTRARAIRSFHEARGLENRQVVIRSASTLYVQHDLPAELPKVSVIIPSRDRQALLAACVDSVVDKTVYDNFEIILIDNDSKDKEAVAWFEEAEKRENVKVLHYPHPFNFAAINNFGAQKANGEILVFLNDDTTVISSAWLKELVRHALRPGVGATGALLYYPNETIQHAGVVCGISKAHIAGHIHRGVSRYDVPGAASFDCVHNYSVVTGACLAVRKEIFDKIDGFKEAFSVCYNDVDLCLRIKKLGYRNVWTPHSVLYHHENVSVAERNEEQARVYTAEANLMRSKYGEELLMDSAFNPNFALDGESQALANEPRIKLPWRI